MSRVPRPLAALLFALALGFAFPFRAGELRFDLGLVLGWLALVPLVWLIRDLRPRAAFGWATLAGSVGYAIVMFWLFVVVHVHGHAPVAVGVLAVGLMAGAFGLHAGVVAWAVRRLAPVAGPLELLLLPAAWIALEQIRGFLVFGGLPWAFLGHTAWTNGPLRELAAWIGVSGIGFLLALFAALLGRGSVRAALGLLAAVHLFGFGLGLGARSAEAPVGEPLRAGIVQGNIPQGEKWDPARADAAFAAHVDASRLAAAGAELDWILWPEAALPMLLEFDGVRRAELAALARETGATLIVGGMGVDVVRGTRAFTNSAFVIAPDGRVADRYDKSRLVPFGEYVPLRSLLGFLSGVATGLSSIDITAGPGPRTLGVGGSGADRPPTALICYEVIYPDVVRQSVRGGAQVLLNLTNDAWYGASSAPHQFLAIAAMRAAEHGLPMLRAANTGISAVIDAGGAVLAQTPLFERRVLVAPVPPARPGRTLYSRVGETAPILAWLILVVAAVRSRLSPEEE